MEFKATNVNGKLVIQPIIEKKDGNVTINVPSFKLIEKLKHDLGQGDHHITKIVKLKKDKR